MLAVLATGTSCGSNEQPELPRIAAPLTERQQQERHLACREAMLSDFAELSDASGDLLRAYPRVSPSAFLSLNEAEQARFIELSACLGAAGAIGARQVTLLSNVSNAEMSVSTAANDIDWAAR